MTSRITVFREPMTALEFDRADRDSTLIAVVDGAVSGGGVIDRMLRRRSMLVVVGEGVLSGAALAQCLVADFLALRESATLAFTGDGDAVAGLARKSGRRALPILLLQREMTAAAAVAAGIAEALVPAGDDSVHWLRSWLGTRDLRALHAGAALIRGHGGDVAERHEFARLFAAGIPQQGLKRFLNKESRRDDGVQWEIR